MKSPGRIIRHCTSPFISIIDCQQQLYGRNVTSKNQDYRVLQNLQSLPFVHFRCAVPSPPRWFGVTETIQHFVYSVFFEKVQTGAMLKIPFTTYISAEGLSDIFQGRCAFKLEFFWNHLNHIRMRGGFVYPTFYNEMLDIRVTTIHSKFHFGNMP